jgi:hypothetical protein
VPKDYEGFEKSFMLKTRRIEYTFGHFAQQEQPQTFKEAADLNLIGEIRF